MIVAGGDPALVLEVADEALDAGAQRVERLVHRVLRLAVPLSGDFRRGAAIAQVLADRIAVVALVGEHHAGVAVARRHEVGVGGDIVRFAGGQDGTDRQTIGVGAKVDLGREATA